MSLDDLELIACGFPIFPNEYPIDPLILTPLFADLTTLSNQLEGLQLDAHTKSLRIEVKRAKRQKLGINLKRVKKEILPQRRLLAQIQQENTLFHSRLNAL